MAPANRHCSACSATASAASFDAMFLFTVGMGLRSTGPCDGSLFPRPSGFPGPQLRWNLTLCWTVQFPFYLIGPARMIKSPKLCKKSLRISSHFFRCFSVVGPPADHGRVHPTIKRFNGIPGRLMVSHDRHVQPAARGIMATDRDHYYPKWPQ